MSAPGSYVPRQYLDMTPLTDDEAATIRGLFGAHLTQPVAEVRSLPRKTSHRRRTAPRAA